MIPLLFFIFTVDKDIEPDIGGCVSGHGFDLYSGPGHAHGRGRGLCSSPGRGLGLCSSPGRGRGRGRSYSQGTWINTTTTVSRPGGELHVHVCVS